MNEIDYGPVMSGASCIAQTLEHIKSNTRHVLTWSQVSRREGKFKITTPENLVLSVIEKKVGGARKRHDFIREKQFLRRKTLLVLVRAGDSLQTLVGRVIHLIKTAKQVIAQFSRRKARRRGKKRHFCVQAAHAH